MGFEEWDSKLTLQHRVLELETRFGPPEQSDPKPASNRQNSRIGLQRVGYGRVGWTALTMCKAVLCILSQCKAT